MRRTEQDGGSPACSFEAEGDPLREGAGAVVPRRDHMAVAIDEIRTGHETSVMTRSNGCYKRLTKGN